MVTRKPAFEKQEHGLRFTFKLITRHNFTKAPAAALNAKWLVDERQGWLSGGAFARCRRLQ
jgi:hypothetical protein